MSVRQTDCRKVKFAVRAVMLAALVFVVFGAAGTPSRADEASSKTVCVLTIHEDITRNTVYLIRRGLRDAEEKRAAALVLDMQTNGGRVDATEEIIRLLENAPMKTYTFVNDKAYSAGAYIAAATDKIFMSPGSVIGAATPVILGESGVQELPKSYEEKLSSAMRARIRATAQEKGYNPDVFEAMVDAGLAASRGGRLYSPRGEAARDLFSRLYL